MGNRTGGAVRCPRCAARAVRPCRTAAGLRRRAGYSPPF
ncbi:hypothetical protein ACLQ2N_30085 [Streptomyces sp. DT224]